MVSSVLSVRETWALPPSNEQFDTGDETGVIRRPETNARLGNFLGFPHASIGDRGHNPSK